MAESIRIEVHIPEKLYGLYEPSRYKVLHGGRGGGKSHSVAQVLLDMACRRTLRVLCAREIQKSMRDSVHRLLRDYIVKMGLTAFYTVTDTEIRGLNGSLFVFAGLQAHTVDSIKSFEGVDVVWVEEAHSVSKRSWDVLIPTIRKEGSEIWLTLNPDLDTDETYQRFVLARSADTWIVQINWRDNPWFPQTLDAERMKARYASPDDYDHIWEGKPRRAAEGAVYTREVESLYEQGRACRVPYDPLLAVHTVWDLGWNDAMTIIMAQRGPQDMRIIDYIEDSHRTLDWYVAELEKRPYRWGTDFLPHDGRTKNFQTGRSTQQQLQALGRPRVMVQGAMNVEEGIKLARMLFPRCYFDEIKAARLLECLRRYRRQLHLKTDEPMAPLHDEYSHGADAFRYLAMAADQMTADVAQEYVEAPEPLMA